MEGVGTRWMFWLCIINKWSGQHGTMWRALWVSLHFLCCLCLFFMDSLEALEWYLPTSLHYRYQTGKSRVTQKGSFCSRKHQPHPLLVVFKGEGALTEGSARVYREVKKQSSPWWSMSCLQVAPIFLSKWLKAQPNCSWADLGCAEPNCFYFLESEVVTAQCIGTYMGLAASIFVQCKEIGGRGGCAYWCRDGYKAGLGTKQCWFSYVKLKRVWNHCSLQEGDVEEHERWCLLPSSCPYNRQRLISGSALHSQEELAVRVESFQSEPEGLHVPSGLKIRLWDSRREAQLRLVLDCLSDRVKARSVLPWIRERTLIKYILLSDQILMKDIIEECGTSTYSNSWQHQFGFSSKP